MISDRSRLAALILAVLYGALGALLFVAPGWGSGVFAWNVSPMVAMTIGGWCLGNAWAALMIFRRPALRLAASGLVYLSLFGILESGVLVAFLDKLKTGTWLAWLYLATLGFNVVAAVLWVPEWRNWLSGAGQGDPGRARLGTTGRVLGVVFVLFVGFLGLYGLFAPAGSRGLSGGIFPQVISMFTLRAFGALYLSVALAPILLILTRDFETVLGHIVLSWGLIFFITVAAFVFISEFDLVARPGQLLYFGAYILVGAVTGFYLFRYGPGRADGDPAPRLPRD
ncbi:MAG: hypothetical protein Q8Q62_14700 [Mesorhizobium sp.]|nr:hypothetical protein [Mesorhizobium sp.]